MCIRDRLYAALIVGIHLVPVGLLQVVGGMYGVIGQFFICPDGICRMVTAVTVSYTHLDVYKRQGCVRPSVRNTP